jgi:hypothetical protein
MKIPIAIIIVTLAVTWLVPSNCSSQSIEDKSTSDYYFRGAFAHLEKISTWECVARSSKNGEYLFIADVSNGCFRYELKSDRRMVFVKNAQGYMAYTSDTKIVTKANDAKLIALPDFKPFDVRILGLGANSEKQAGYSLDSLRESMSKNSFIRIDRPDDKSVRVVCEEAMGTAPPLIREYLISLDQDFSCLGTRVSYTFGGTNTELSRSSTKHELLHGIWLPVQCEHYQSNKLDETMELTWKSVNGSIDPREFQVEGLKVPLGTYVGHQIDDKSDPVLDHIVGESKVLGELSDVRKATEQSRSARRNRRHLVWGTAIVALILLLTVYAVFKSRT